MRSFGHSPGHTFAFRPFAALLMAVSIEQILDKKKLSYTGLCLSALLFVLLFFKNPGTTQASTPLICIWGFLMMAVLILGWQKKFSVSPVLIFVCCLSWYDKYDL